MKLSAKFLVLIFLLGAHSAYAYTNDTLAKCSALNNNFNQKYGAQLLDNGYTHNTVLKDELYHASSVYQLMLMAKISHLESWNLSSYNRFLDEIESSEFYSKVWFYDNDAMQRLSLGELKIRMSEIACFNKFQGFARSPGEENIILKNFDKLTPYLQKMRGF